MEFNFRDDMAQFESIFVRILTSNTNGKKHNINQTTEWTKQTEKKGIQIHKNKMKYLMLISKSKRKYLFVCG